MICKIIKNNKKYLCIGKFRIKYGRVSPIKILQNHIDKMLNSNLANLEQTQNEIIQKIGCVQSKLLELQSITLPAFHVHQKVFPKYKGINKGKDVVLMGAGPTLNQYQPIKNAIHIGTNRTFKFDKVLLDYLFIQDKADLIKGGFSTTPDKYKELQDIVLTQWQNMGQGVTKEEFNQAKNYMIASYNLRFASIMTIADILTAMQKYNLGLDFLQKRNAYVQNVTLEEVNRAAKKYFDRSRLVSAAIGGFEN